MNRLIKVFILPLVFFVNGCISSNTILKNQNFDDGDWLLVQYEISPKTIRVIDDEKVLKSNPNGINIWFIESDSYTTEDGEIMLYKNGELIVAQYYLDYTRLWQTKSIKKAYKVAQDSFLIPIDYKAFQLKWDSIKSTPRHYPTIYHTMYDDRDIIWYFEYEE